MWVRSISSPLHKHSATQSHSRWFITRPVIRLTWLFSAPDYRYWFQWSMETRRVFFNYFFISINCLLLSLCEFMSCCFRKTVTFKGGETFVTGVVSIILVLIMFRVLRILRDWLLWLLLCNLIPLLCSTFCVSLMFVIHRAEMSK